MAKATKKASAKASSSEAKAKKIASLKKAAPKAAKKATRAKKPAAAKKVTRTKVARPKAVPVKKVARKAQPVCAVRKVAVKAVKAPKAPKAPAAKPPVRPKPAIASGRTVLMAAPAEYHAPATTVAKLKAAAKTPAAKASPVKTPTAGLQRATAPKPSPVKASKPAKKVARRATKPATLVVSPAAIDTSLAAEVAANMVLNHMVPGPAAGHLEKAVTDLFSRANVTAKTSPPKRETSTFKHIKETVANPTSHHLDGLFGVLATQKRPKLPFGRFPSGTAPHLDKTFGLDVKRMNGLRRKAG